MHRGGARHDSRQKRAAWLDDDRFIEDAGHSGESTNRSGLWLGLEALKNGAVTVEGLMPC